MIELNLPKLSWLTKASIGFFEDGTQDGTLGLTLAFSGRPVDADEAASALSSLLSLPLPRTRMVRLTGSFPSVEDQNFRIFIQALRKYNFATTAIITPSQIGTWLDSVQWVILRSEHNLLMIQPNELWYTPKGDSVSEWHDIVMPSNPNKATFMFFNRTKGVDDTESFFCNSQYHWQLL